MIPLVEAIEQGKAQIENLPQGKNCSLQVHYQ